jgi:hypothetical protein
MCTRYSGVLSDFGVATAIDTDGFRGYAKIARHLQDRQSAESRQTDRLELNGGFGHGPSRRTGKRVNSSQCCRMNSRTL